ncbi:MAG: glycoside hydrolase family 99-like domain-containing protein [Planctomycetota bacterium]
MKRTWLMTVAFTVMLVDLALAGEETTPAPTLDDDNSGEYTVACYYFPNYHPNDPRNEERLGKGWSEWELVKNAKPRFPGHRQPRVPLWGHTDESDPKVMAQKIAAAADHGIDAFIFDWYYFDGLFLERGLEEGFLKAANNRRLKFALMWANHDWIDIFPATLDHKPKRVWPGTVTPETFDKITDYVIEKYFKHPSHWTINGRPYFSFYDLGKLLESFGSVEATRAELEKFRAKTRAAGFPGLHLNAVAWGQPMLPGTGQRADLGELVAQLGFDSVTSYVWVHHVQLPDFPETQYGEAMEKYFDYCDRAEKQFDVPYYPNVTVGWDSSPRCDPAGPFLNRGYPYTPTLAGNTPEAFQAALERMKGLLDRRPADERIFNINCFNEWTEGSYLEPDTVYGMKYLEAVREVFGDKGQ